MTSAIPADLYSKEYIVRKMWDAATAASLFGALFRAAGAVHETKREKLLIVFYVILLYIYLGKR